jgi:transcription elongation GreA/GreB family factor
VGEDKEVCVELVEDWDADPLNGKISKSCPLGVALNGKMAGETTEVITSKGSYKVIIIRK